MYNDYIILKLIIILVLKFLFFKMIRSSALSDLLKKVISNGIETVFICRLSGEILCIEGKDSSQALADLNSSMWSEYYQIGLSTLKEEKMKFLLIENDDSNIITTNLYDYIICMKANTNMKLGMLKKNIEGLAQNLNKMLEPIKNIIVKNDEINNE